MKTIVYAIAGIAALGIMIVLIASPGAISSSPTADGPAASAVSANNTVLEEAGTLTLEIPSMHCQFACYPKVKKTLEKSSGVSEVALVEQPEPDTLTVKKVTVKYDAGFDVDAAMTSLKNVGFDDATQIQ